jgi:S-adenosylmethionine hydrolase
VGRLYEQTVDGSGVSGESEEPCGSLLLCSVNAPVSFLSDFGGTDEFVGVVHGVIARIAPSTRIIDITHGIEHGDIHGGAMALTRAVQYMPEGVFLAVVDPGVGTGRKAIAARTPVGYFVGPDNGLLAPAVAMVGGSDLIVSLEDDRFQLPAKGATFAGRDVFGPASAVLASGQAEIEDLGPVLDSGSISPLLIPLAEPAGNGAMRGSVLWIDTFGNVQFNVSPEDLAALEIEEGDDVLVSFNMEEFRIVWGSTYGDVEEGEAVVHVDSHGQIAIAVRGGRADEAFSFGVGDTVVLGRPDGGNRIQLQVAAGD